MSILSRISSLKPDAAPEQTPDDPVAPLALALASATTEAARTAAAVATAREALEAVQPAAHATADAFVTALDRARFAVAKAADTANYAAAAKDAAAASYDAARALQLQGELASSRAGVALAAGAQLVAVHRFGEQLMEARAVLASAIRAHAATVSEFEETTGQRAPAFEPGSLASVVESLIDKRPGLIPAVATAAAFLAWEAGAATRAREAAANAARAAADDAAAAQRLAIAGHAGPAAQLAAHAGAREALARFYAHPAGPVFMPSAPPELAKMQDDLARNAQPEAE